MSFLDIYDHEAFLRCGVPFYAVCTNVETGRPEYLQITDMKSQIECLRASASLPFFSRIVEIGEKKYLDGGCTDSVPIQAFRHMGFKRNVVVLTQPQDYIKKPISAIAPKLFYRKYPAFAQALCNRHAVYNQTSKQIGELEHSGEIFVIRPEKALDIGRLEKDPSNVQRVYDIGRADAQKCMQKLLDWLRG